MRRAGRLVGGCLIYEPLVELRPGPCSEPRFRLRFVSPTAETLFLYPAVYLLPLATLVAMGADWAVNGYKMRHVLVMVSFVITLLIEATCSAIIMQRKVLATKRSLFQV